jgi:hypothetical protein
MSTDVRTQAGQALSSRNEDVPTATGGRESPQMMIQESIKYRRRAQDAERRAEALEAEVQNLRQGENQRLSALEQDLTQTRTEAETLRGRLVLLERDRRLEREFLRAGCADPETALALARDRLSGPEAPEDPVAFARGLLEEKPFLRSAPAASRPPTGVPPAVLPPRTAAAKPPGGPVRIAERLAQQARSTGNTGDLMAYMQARRAGT